MRYFIVALLLPIVNFADDMVTFYNAKTYAQNRIEKFECIKANHEKMYPEIKSNPSFVNFIYDPIYHYGYITGAQAAYMDMLIFLD